MATLVAETPVAQNAPEAVVVRFAGDSGDGMQLTGGQFTLSTALAGNDLATFPDFPAEIRAPQGTLFGVSAFQIDFGSTDIETAGDQPDVLMAMNPAALKTNVNALKPGMGMRSGIVTSLTSTDRECLERICKERWLGLSEQPCGLDAARSPKRRDLGFAAVMERIEGLATNPDAEYLVRLNRALFM